MIDKSFILARWSMEVRYVK